MATPPVFVSGQILTAAQMNSVGMWLVKATALATTTDVTSCFTTDFTSYQIVCNVTSTGSVGPTAISAQLLSGSTPLAGTGYSWTLQQQAYATGTVVTSFTAGGSNWSIGRADSATTNAMFVANIINPFAASEPTIFESRWADNTTTGSNSGINSSAASYDGLRITGMTNPVGTVSVYGYR
jgi:hypothetical protein